MLQKLDAQRAIKNASRAVKDASQAGTLHRETLHRRDASQAGFNNALGSDF